MTRAELYKQAVEISSRIDTLTSWTVLIDRRREPLDKAVVKLIEAVELRRQSMKNWNIIHDEDPEGENWNTRLTAEMRAMEESDGLEDRAIYELDEALTAVRGGE